jgi:hypothetical protein
MTCWMAPARAGDSPSERVATLPLEEQASKVLVERLRWGTCEGIHIIIIREYRTVLSAAGGGPAHGPCPAAACGSA